MPSDMYHQPDTISLRQLTYHQSDTSVLECQVTYAISDTSLLECQETYHQSGTTLLEGHDHAAVLNRPNVWP
jgi:hypothetical protein